MVENLGVIQSIRAVHDERLSADPYNGMGDGYVVQTMPVAGGRPHRIVILIANTQKCCENWGYMASEDNLDTYVGAILREIRLTDTALNEVRLDKVFPYGFEGEIQFVDCLTDRGMFQLAVYNEHNGYYGHTIRITQDDEVLFDECL